MGYPPDMSTRNTFNKVWNLSSIYGRRRVAREGGDLPNGLPWDGTRLYWVIPEEKAKQARANGTLTLAKLERMAVGVSGLYYDAHVLEKQAKKLTGVEHTIAGTQGFIRRTRDDLRYVRTIAKDRAVH